MRIPLTSVFVAIVLQLLILKPVTCWGSDEARYLLPTSGSGGSAQPGDSVYLVLRTEGIDHPFEDVWISWYDSSSGSHTLTELSELHGENLAITVVGPTPDGTGTILDVVDADESVVFSRPIHKRLILAIQGKHRYQIQNLDDRFYQQAQLNFRDWNLDVADDSPFEDYLETAHDTLLDHPEVSASGRHYSIDINGDEKLDVVHYGFYESEVPVLRVWIGEDHRLIPMIHVEGVLAAFNPSLDPGIFSFSFLTIEPAGQQITALEEVYAGNVSDSTGYSAYTTIYSWGCKKPTEWLPYPLMARLSQTDMRLSLSPSGRDTISESTKDDWVPWSILYTGQDCQVLAREVIEGVGEWLFVVAPADKANPEVQWIVAELHPTKTLYVGGWLPSTSVELSNVVAALPFKTVR